MAAADVVEVEIDALRRNPAQLLGEVTGAVVYGGVQPECVGEVPRLLGAPADPITSEAPRAFASWAATEPTAPAAADTQTRSPGCIRATSTRPM